MKVFTIVMHLFFVLARATESDEIKSLSEINDKIDFIDSFKVSNRRLIEIDLTKTIEEAKIFSHSKFLDHEEEIKNDAIARLSQFKKKFDDMEYDLDIETLKKKRDSLAGLIDERRKYLKAQQIIDELPNDEKVSKKFKKYCQLIQVGKNTEASLLKIILSKEEKEKVKIFDENFKLVAINKSNQKFRIEQIKDEYHKLSKSLSYPLQSIDQMNLIKTQMAKINEEQKNIIKNLDQVIQYDFQLPNIYETGFFSCEQETAKYLRFKKYPDLVVLDKDGTYNSIIKLDQKNPKSLNIVYHCKEMGMFGNCLEDKEKKLCQLDPDCKSVLDEAENIFKEHNFFSDVKQNFLFSILNSKKNEFLNQENFSVINEFARLNRLGIFNREKIDKTIQNLISKLSKVEAATPEMLHKKLQTIVKQMQQQDLEIIKKNNPNDKDSETVLSYIYASVGSELQKIADTELIQKFIIEHCQEYPAALAFCSKYNEFKRQVRSFDEVEEIKNYTPKACPRFVFRIEDTGQGGHSSLKETTPCQAQNIEDKKIMQLQDDVDKITTKVSN